MFSGEDDLREHPGWAGSSPEGAIKKPYPPAWLPLTEDGGNHLGGDPGQVITFDRN